MPEARPLKVETTVVFRRWLAGVRDRQAVDRIATRLRQLSDGLIGDARAVGGGVSELRIHHGPGYRLYFTLRSKVLIVLLCGGDKSSQRRDIALAQELARDEEMDDGA